MSDAAKDGGCGSVAAAAPACDVEYFAPRSAATLRVILGSAAPQHELLGSASVLCAFSNRIDRLVSSLDENGFAEALPGEGFRFFDDDAASWRSVFAELHQTGPPRFESSLTPHPLPLRLDGVKVICLCAPSAADVRIIAGSGCEEWEFLCSSSALQLASDYFRAALRGGTWRERRTNTFGFPGDDASDWELALSSFHAPSDTPAKPPPDLHRAVCFLGFCQKYLFSDLEGAAQRALLDDPGYLSQLSTLGAAAFLQLARELAFLGALPAVLESWCLSGGRPLARHVAALLDDARLATAALALEGVRAFLVSDEFLGSGGVFRPGGPLARLAALGRLDILCGRTGWACLGGPADVECMIDDENLVPLLQLKSLRRELQHRRFCQPPFAATLQHFPNLLDELLFTWFGPAKSPKPMAPRELAEWASCRKFRHEGLLDAQLRVTGAQDFGAFAMDAPYDEAEVRQSVQHKVACLSQEAWSDLLWAPPAISALLANPKLLRRLLAHGVVEVPGLMRAVVPVVLFCCLAPVRAIESVRSLLQAVAAHCVRRQTNGASAQMKAFAVLLHIYHTHGLAAAIHKVVANALRYASSEAHNLRDTVASVLSVTHVAFGATQAHTSIVAQYNPQIL